MNMLTRKIVERVSALPEREQREILDFIEFLQSRLVEQSSNAVSETALLSESVLTTDWNRVEEDEAWAKFQ